MPIKANSPTADFKGSVYDLPQNGLILPDITKEDLLNSIKNSKSSVSKGDLKQYEDWTNEFGVE